MLTVSSWANKTVALALAIAALVVSVGVLIVVAIPFVIVARRIRRLRRARS